MSTTYKELLDQQRELDAKIVAARRAERPQAIETIRALMAQFDITVSELAAKPDPRRGGSAQPKYRDPTSGATWSGMGREPRWIAGKDRSAFAI